MQNSDTTGNRTRDLPACSAVPHPKAPPRVPNTKRSLLKLQMLTATCSAAHSSPKEHFERKKVMLVSVVKAACVLMKTSLLHFRLRSLFVTQPFLYNNNCNPRLPLQVRNDGQAHKKYNMKNKITRDTENRKITRNISNLRHKLSQSHSTLHKI
jgi:hypothetical protein